MMPRRGLLVALMILPHALGAGAQVPDPTRPPEVLLAPANGGGALPLAESGVHTVILRRGGKSAAVINGQYVTVGGKLGEKRVVGISESEVVLKGEGGTEVIKLIPAVEKAQAKKPAEANRRAKGTKE